MYTTTCLLIKIICSINIYIKKSFMYCACLSGKSVMLKTKLVNIHTKKNQNQKMDIDINLETIGNNFVYEYYTVLSKCPQNLKKYYEKYSIFVHRVSANEVRTVVGQKDINDCIIQLDYKGCKTNILSINTQNLCKYIMISVVGELTKRQSLQKKFTRTIVLSYNDRDEYIIKNDMFFYSDNKAQSHFKNKREIDTREWRNKKHNNKIQTLNQVNKPSYPPVSHQLFVSGIPASIKPQALRHFFEQYGQLYSLRVMKKNVNYGFITFVKSESAKKVLQDRPIIFPNESGVWLVVKEKRKTFQNGENMYLPTNHQLFIGDIPDNVTSDDLKYFFNKWGEIVSVRIMVMQRNAKYDMENIHGFVTFKTELGAKAVLKNKPIVFPNENDGIELKVMEKYHKSIKNKFVTHEKSKKGLKKTKE